MPFAAIANFVGDSLQPEGWRATKKRSRGFASTVLAYYMYQIRLGTIAQSQQKNGIGMALTTHKRKRNHENLMFLFAGLIRKLLEKTSTFM
jgi:hypothetical protein